ncbi:Hypothetical protein PP7435_CHR1-2214 [Komagataella phaffii CBS 7435]|uniref:Uncharacterized protein n=1 Tax=Komagataella phaffii (strain ATCC 76273 / CBS 7435 / CECT 11047 / NRRL Y-11430 / Wegner 21-1) TaxID=981350 RepID=A0A1G4KP95_KOMPC|nr:Hypothetical protein BQ9382_C1-3262 [Komagataella phaffii CBS 7435]SCV11826.1 Hypothetical protein PP7435_CHR1-2214 [Komagataella phaffii CBS 7435]
MKEELRAIIQPLKGFLQRRQQRQKLASTTITTENSKKKSVTDHRETPIGEDNLN